MPETSDFVVGGDHCFITCSSGKQFHLHGSDPAEIDIEDIAHHLSMVTRFTGAISRPHSIAEHSILVMSIVDSWPNDGPEVLLQALMHDASEAYIADIAAPFKGELANYREIEGLVMHRILDRFSISRDFPKLIKDADWIALFVEALSLFPNSNCHEWKQWSQWGHLAEAWIGLRGPITQDMIHPLAVKESFLASFNTLMDTRPKLASV